MTGDHPARARLVLPGLFFLAPLALLAFFLTDPARDPAYMIPVEHFYVVSGAALAALALAVVVGVASVRTRRPRTLLVAVAFLAVAGIFSVHGLMTPGERMPIKSLHNGILVSARLSLLVGGLFFFASTLDLPVRVERMIARHHRRLLAAAIVAVGLFIGANLARPTLLDFVPTGDEPAPAAPAPSHASSGLDLTLTGGYGEGPTAGAESHTPAPVRDGGWLRLDGRLLSHAMAVVAGLGLALAAWRYGRVYAVSRLPATATLAIGLTLLAEAQISMTLGEPWHLSWWLYHVLMLVGFLVPIGGIAFAYARGGSLAEIVDGLFLRDTLARLERSFPDAMDALVAAIEAKDPYLRGHCRRVCELSVEIAAELGLPNHQLRAVTYGALLHDVGKIAIPDAVLQKPGRPTDEEAAALREHPARGEHIALQAPSLREAAPAIRWHHERLDGSGYPDALIGDAIPLEARIVAVADVWDALTSDRVYRAAWTAAAARDLLAREAGVQLDPRCVRALFAVLDRRPVDVTRRLALQRMDEERRGTALLAG